ncbi:MAG: iron-sulfur cluster carrier protein ApbC [Proteobacteria bacterium]|nr:iron-sulfur cluster carrier protein ApbC [Pseudomonadota bacterium]
MSQQDAILAALARIAGPDGTTPLPQSGALSAITVAAGKAYFSIAVDPARAGAMEPMRKAAEQAAAAVAGLKGAVVTLTADKAPAPAATAAQPQSGKRAPHGVKLEVPGVKHIIAVASGKGGVGKSTTSVNLALALQRLGQKVGVLDADIYGPSMPKLLGIKGRPTMGENKMLRPMEGYGLKVMSIGFLVDEDSAMIWRGPMVMGALQQMLREVAWGDLDVLVVDMPPGTGDAQLTMAQNVPLAGAVIVSTPQDLALIDARRGVAMFRKVDVPILGVVENMATFVCPNCGATHDIFGHGGARKEAERIGAPFLGEVPLAMTIREKSDAGRPIVVTEPDGPHAAAYMTIARGVLERLHAGAGQRKTPSIIFDH